MGGKKGKGGTPREAPNTLANNSIARIVDIISEGPIKGLVNGLQSVFLDDGTAVQAYDGKLNFKGVSVETRNGDPDQAAFAGFPLVEAEESVGVQMLYGVPVIRTISDLNLDRVNVKVRFPVMSQQIQSSGDLVGVSVDFDIEIKPFGGSYTRVPLKYSYTVFDSDSVTASDVVGLRVLASENVTGQIGQTVSNTFEFYYRLQGAGSWTLGETRTLSYVITLNDFFMGLFSLKDNGLYLGTNPVATKTMSAQFDATGLAAGIYEVMVVGGDVTKAEALAPTFITVSGKNTSPTEKQYSVPLEGAGPWDIRLSRLTTDSVSTYLQNDTYWSSYTKIIDAKIQYSDTACIALTLDSQAFGSSIPNRSYEIYGLEIQVPDNYDPDTRIYTGIWGGNFQTAYTNNPAWVLYDLLTNTRYGLGNYISADQIDKFAFYEIAQYCDELVDDGYGGTEPRYTFNMVINQRQEAYQVINLITQCFHGMAYWAAGAITCAMDKPSDPVKLVSNSNVIGGKFDYSSTGRRARHSVALVSYNDPMSNYKLSIASVQDQGSLNQFGWNPIDVVAYGCTSKGQALRYGRWVLDTERYQTQSVKYQTGLDHFDVVPGDIVLIADAHYAGARGGGACGSGSTTTSIVLDSEVTLEAATTYTLYLMMTDGEMESKTVTSAAGVHSTLTVSSAFSAAPLVGFQWALSSVELEPRQFRVINISERDDLTYEITALNHDPDKYDRIEANMYCEQPIYTLDKSGPITSPPNGLTITEFLKETPGGVVSAATLSWIPPDSGIVDNYIVSYKGPYDPEYRLLGETTGLSIDLVDTVDGLYYFKVIGESKFLRLQSPEAEASFELFALKAPPSDVENFACAALGDVVNLTWDHVTDLDLDYYVLRFTPLTTGATWAASQILVSNISKNQTTVTVPAMVGTYLIKAIDTLGIESENEATIVSTFSGLSSMNAVLNITEDPTFLGTHTDTATDGVGLFLTSGTVVDDWPVVNDVLNFGIGDGDLQVEGTYDFADTQDLGAVYTSRLTATIEASGSNYLDQIDAWPVVDDIEFMDGATAGSWEVELQIRTTNDDTTGSPVWSAWQKFIVGDYTARGFEFRLVLRSFSYGVSPYVTALAVSIDMPDSVQSENNIASGVGAYYQVTFPSPFKAIPSVGVTGQDMATGDYFTITNITRTGFRITFRASSSTIVSRTFDYQAVGYGIES